MVVPFIRYIISTYKNKLVACCARVTQHDYSNCYFYFGTSLCILFHKEAVYIYD